MSAPSTNPKTQKPEKSFSITEVAERLGCTKRTAWDMVRFGKIPGFRAGRNWRVLESVLNRHMGIAPAASA